MDAILQTLHELEGVHGTIVADGTGQIIAHRAHAVYDLELLRKVSRVVVSTIDTVKLLQEDWESVAAQFSEGKILISNLATLSNGKGSSHFLSVIADTRLNPSFAGIAIRVAVSKLKSLLEGGSPLQVTGSGAFATSGSFNSTTASTHGLPMGAASQVPMASRLSSPEVAGSGLSWSGLGGSSTSSSSGVSVADPASSNVLTACTKALARSVGPMAKMYVKEAVRKICPDRPFSKESTAALLSELERHIEDPADTLAFREAVKKLH